jgi:deoxyribonuclease-1-like protein
MKYFVMILMFFIAITAFAQKEVKICSWNIRDFGASKNEKEIDFIASVLKEFDVIAIQEVVAGPGGAQAVAILNEALNTKGEKWDYTISNPTFSSSYEAERYAFVWKTAFIKKKGDAWLENKYKVEIDREPYFATFIAEQKEFTLVNFHAITKSKQPETEIKYFKYMPDEYAALHLIFIGDFNCPQSHTVFNPLKAMGYQPALINQKTSLRRQCINDDCLASEFDNIFYNTKSVIAAQSGIVPFYTVFSTLEEANTISDHVPIFLKFTLN